MFPSFFLILVFILASTYGFLGTKNSLKNELIGFRFLKIIKCCFKFKMNLMSYNKMKKTDVENYRS